MIMVIMKMLMVMVVMVVMVRIKKDPKNPNIIFHRTPDPATFPMPPNNVRIVDRESTTVTISWRKNAYEGTSPLIGYTIEYYCADLQVSKNHAMKEIKRSSYRRAGWLQLTESPARLTQ